MVLSYYFLIMVFCVLNLPFAFLDIIHGAPDRSLYREDGKNFQQVSNTLG